MYLFEIFFSNVNWIVPALNNVECFALSFYVVCVSNYCCHIYSFVCRLVNPLFHRSLAIRNFYLLMLSCTRASTSHHPIRTFHISLIFNPLNLFTLFQ